MEFVWIPIAVGAALMQAVRTAAQKDLNERLSTMVTTYVRSLFAWPFLLAYLALVWALSTGPQPALHGTFLAYSVAAALTQIGATALLIHLFALKNFAVGTTLSKTDVMITAILGSILFSESIDALGWLAILLTVAGVVMISVARLGLGAFTGGGGLYEALAGRPTQIGFVTGLLFALCYLFLREASLSLGEGSFLLRAGWTVVTVTGVQVVVLGLWLIWAEPSGLKHMAAAWRPCIFIGLTSALGSIGWFTAMTLENASYVKAVGQVETVFTLAISYLYFKERLNSWELVGIAVIVAGVLLFLL